MSFQASPSLIDPNLKPKGFQGMTEEIICRKPQIYLTDSAAARMWMVSLCALLAILQSAMGDSGKSLILALVAVGSGVLTELLINVGSSKYTLRDGSAVASALIFTLLLPNTIHPAATVLGSLFAMAVLKHSFGGIGSNWLNPALGAWIFVRFSWPQAFSEALEGSILETGSYGAFSALQGTSSDSVSKLLNNLFFSHFNAQLPAGYIELFSLSGPGIIADRGVFALMVGTILISAAKINRPVVPAFFLATFALLVYFFAPDSHGSFLGKGDMLFAFLSGGTILAAFVLATDPATLTKSRLGSMISAFIIALLSFFLRYRGHEAYAAFYAVAAVNAVIPAIRGLEKRFIYLAGSRK